MKALVKIIQQQILGDRQTVIVKITLFFGL